MKNQDISNSIDWISIFLYFILVVFGWMTIYSVTVPANQEYTFDFSLKLWKTNDFYAYFYTHNIFDFIYRF